MKTPTKKYLDRTRHLVDRVCSQLSLTSQRATLAASGPEPEMGAAEIVACLDDVKAELQELARIARRWARETDASNRRA